jgi:hypothetical protein
VPLRSNSERIVRVRQTALSMTVYNAQDMDIGWGCFEVSVHC